MYEPLDALQARAPDEVAAAALAPAVAVARRAVGWLLAQHLEVAQVGSDARDDAGAVSGAVELGVPNVAELVVEAGAALQRARGARSSRRRRR